jgi:hypothetical protein
MKEEEIGCKPPDLNAGEKEKRCIQVVKHHYL